MVAGCVLAAGMMVGCGSGLRTVQQPAHHDPPKGSSDWAIRNNPNIPESAKKAMLGSKY